MKKVYFLFAVLLLSFNWLHAQLIVGEKNGQGSFPVAAGNTLSPVYVDSHDETLVQKAAAFLQGDIEMVCGKKPELIHSLNASSRTAIIIGSMGSSSLIQQLVKEKKISLEKIRGKWEAYQVQIVSNPAKGIDKALVIAGSDRRGTAYGVFELSKQLGVSPWYWWADVPVKNKKDIFIQSANVISDAPKVKYRGIFINDEAPALSGWSKEKFGGFNHSFYEKVFELILRLKANYLWPAMWGNAFYDDDPLNIQSADDFGVVIGTSHHEPLMRAHDEWRRYGKDKWNYDSNELRLKEFWKGGMQRATNEKIVSIGMRGDGDEPMSRETATALLERIVKDQRVIIEEVTGKPADATPQLWALYKEVQDYYDKGMRVPDDVTLLLCDDNWGNIRKLPKLTDKPRKGGYGIYYHFDYVGGPRNYKWINTNNLARVWEQMHLAWEYGAKNIWIVNVGDIKPMELPTSFFLDYAWDPVKWNEDNLGTYYTNWARQQFGETYAKEIGDILRKYSQYSARRKPELTDANTYSLVNYNEASNVLKEWRELLRQSEKIAALLPAVSSDAYYQLVLHPVKAFTNLQQMYVAMGLNRLHAARNYSTANDYAEEAKRLYLKDSLITLEYHALGGGKWNHMMDQTHIGYTYWQQPPANKMQEVKYVSKEAAVEPPMPVDSTVYSARTLIPATAKGNLFYEWDGYVSIDAEHWTTMVNGPKIKWKRIPDIGRTGSGVTTFPVTLSQPLSASSPHLDYEFYTYDTGKLNLNLYFSPTLNFRNDEGLLFAVSLDDEKPVVVSLNKDDNDPRNWNGWVANNIIIKKTEQRISKPGKHVLKYWMISPGVILQKLVIDMGGLKPSYLGPAETKFK